eukprot:gene7270-7483_t
MSCSFAELYQVRVKVEHEILNGDRTEKQRLTLLDQVDALSKQLGHRQLSTPIRQLSELLHDADPAVCQNAASTLSLLASRSVFNQFRIGCEQGVVAGLVQLLQDPQESWVRGSAASALAHLAANSYRAMQSSIVQHGAVPLLVDLLHDTEDGQSGIAALALGRLCENHSKNQTFIGQAPGAVSGLVCLMAGLESQPAVMARGAVKRLVLDHPVNRMRVTRAMIALTEQQQWRVQQLAGLQMTI